jgi:hypothetical protein
MRTDVSRKLNVCLLLVYIAAAGLFMITRPAGDDLGLLRAVIRERRGGSNVTYIEAAVADANGMGGGSTAMRRSVFREWFLNDTIGVSIVSLRTGEGTERSGRGLTQAIYTVADFHTTSH